MKKKIDENELELLFKAEAKKAKDEIKNLLTIATSAIKKAEKISEKYGVPFHSYVSPIGQSYFPKTMEAKFTGLDKQFICDLTGAYHSEFGTEGWQHSDVC